MRKNFFFIKKAVDMDIYFAGQLGDLGKSLYEQRLYKEAALVFEIATSNKESKSLLDNFT
jgi:uncharacterized protein HemY